MLEFLKLQVGNGIAGESSINIWYKNGRLRFAYDRAAADQIPNIIVKVPESVTVSFLKDLQDIQIYKWKDHYQPPKNSKKKILSDFSWALLYKEEDGKPKSSDGQNAYPRKWNAFISLIDRLVNESQAVHLNGLARVDFHFHNEKPVTSVNPLTMEQEKTYIVKDEILTISRYDEKLQYIQRIGNDTVINHEYRIPEIIDYLLGNCERYFGDFTAKKYVAPVKGKPVIRINLRYRNGRNAGFTRTYDRHGVPDDWNDLLEDIRTSMAYYGLFGSIFDPALYRHGVKNGEYIYLSVIAEPGGKSYYYRTEDDSCELGDLVVVPFGANNEERVVMISGIHYCTKENVPYPLEKTKFIVGKYRSDMGQWNTSEGDSDDFDNET